MKHIFLVRYNEIHLKGLNRPFFERRLMENIKAALADLTPRVAIRQGRLFVEAAQHAREEALVRLARVFGIHSVSPALEVDKQWNAIAEGAVGLVEEALEEAGGQAVTFKVEARRSDKLFPMDSSEINRELGALLLQKFPGLTVDVHHPALRVGVEIREQSAYVYVRNLPGPGGMPTGTAGRGLLLLSGGIDSPVAGYLMAKRGMELHAVHFYSYPYTSVRARDKVVELARLLAGYCGGVTLHLVAFTDIQRMIYDKCPPKETTLVMRRVMMRIAGRIAKEVGAGALITGEALGQVASQTLESLAVTDDAAGILVLRPLAGFDKEEIVTVAKRIGTFETSILPYEDCCTVFVPRHPATKPSVERLRESEARLELGEMLDAAIAGREIMPLNHR